MSIGVNGGVLWCNTRRVSNIRRLFSAIEIFSFGGNLFILEIFTRSDLQDYFLRKSEGGRFINDFQGFRLVFRREVFLVGPFFRFFQYRVISQRFRLLMLIMLMMVIRFRSLYLFIFSSFLRGFSYQIVLTKMLFLFKLCCCFIRCSVIQNRLCISYLIT